MSVHFVDYTVEVTVSPPTTEVVVESSNDSLTLMCNVMGLSGGTIQWRKDGSIIDDSARHTVNSDVTSSILQIKNLTKSDEGNYHCVYDHNGAIFNSNQAVVSIKGSYIVILCIYMFLCSDIPHVLVVMVEFTQLAGQSRIMLTFSIAGYF